MAVKKFTKQPAEILDYDIDLTDWFEDRVDSISTVTSTVPVGLTLLATNIVSPIARLVIGGGTDGQTYRITSLITTANGLTKEVDFDLRIKEI